MVHLKAAVASAAGAAADAGIGAAAAGQDEQVDHKIDLPRYR